MSRLLKITLIIAGSLAGLILTLFVAAIVAVQTPWFHNFIRSKIVSVVDEHTGGTASVGSVDLSVTPFRVAIHDFVMRGLEPATAPPLFQAKLIQADLSLLSPFKGFVDLAALLVDSPQANVIVFPNGRTNIPMPKRKSTTTKSALQTMVDLKIGKFDLRNGSVAFADQKAKFSADGRNLRAQLAWQPASASYIGEIDMNPLNWRPDNGPQILASVRVPLTLHRNGISIAGARFATAQSQIAVSGSVEHLAAPVYRVHANGRLALRELQQAAQLKIPVNTTAGPQFLTVDLAGSASANRVQIENAHLNLGQSNLIGSGTLKGGAGIDFRGSLALGQLGHLFRISGQLAGTLVIGGNASLDANNSYLVRANMRGRGLSVRQGTTRLSGVSVESAVTAAPHRIELTGLRVGVLAGALTGTASLTNMAQLHFFGNLRNFDIAPVARVFLGKMPGASVPYSGMLSGPIGADANIKSLATLEAHANLTIAPLTGQGIPLSGRLNVSYNARSQTVSLRQSYLDLPHTRIDLVGSLGQQIQVRMVTRDFADFRPIAAIPIKFQRGDAVLNATVTGTPSSPRIAGQIAMTNFAVEGRSFSRFAAGITAARTGIAISNASLTRDTLQAQITASVGLRNWKPEPGQPLRADLTVRNGDLADVLALAEETGVSAAGTLTADAHITGTFGVPQGNLDLKVTNGNIEGNLFQTLAARVAFTPGAIELPSLELVAAPARITANATYQYSPNDLKRGLLRAHITGTQMQLADIPPLVQDRPGLRGIVSWNGDMAADIAPSSFQIRNLNANLSARDLQLEGHHLGDLTATASTGGNTIRYNVASDFAGSNIRASGQTLLTGDHYTTASASIANLPVPQALALAGRRDLPFSGSLNANASFSGTLNNPQLNASFSVSKGSAYQQPFDRLQATLRYTNQLIEIPTLQVSDGPAELTFSASFSHAAGDLQDGQWRFSLRSNSMDLARLHAVEQYKPGLAGTLRLTAVGAATVRRNQPPLFSTLNADLRASGLRLNRKPLGDIILTADTRGSQLTFNLNSNFASSNIYGTGRLTLAGDYPLTSQIRFSNLTYSDLTTWTGSAPLPGIAASAEGQITITGAMARPGNLRGEIQLTKFEARSVQQPNRPAPRVNFEIHNQGPLPLALNGSQITVQNAHFTGTTADLTVSGTAGLTGTQPLNLHVTANGKLDILQAFDPDILSSGGVRVNADVTGTIGKPTVAGRLELRNASLNSLSLSNGISNANGVIAFNGTEAVIQSLTGETGGGKVSLTGFMAYGAPQMQFRLQATANRVRLAYPQNVSTEVNARLTLTGTTTRSVLSGNVSVLSFVLHENADIGSLLSQAAAPPTVSRPSTGLMAGITFDVRIATAPDVQFRTSITQNLEATADLTLRGTIDHPGMFGRIAITQGDVIFFGARYTITQGSIQFFNPNQINPNIRIDLETMTQGTTVTITVSGPMDRLQLSYHSDPPLRFDEIVALLVTGRTPTTDPVLAPYASPGQNLQQQGLSALLGQGVANPVTSRLQRLFGVTRVSVNPMVTGITNTPQATLTLVQQVTPSITLTYVQDVSSSNPLTVQVEWAINSRWSILVQRDIYGELNLNFLYKRRFH